MQKRRAAKGFTLIEIVVAMCVSAVLFASAFSVIAPVYRVYAHTRAQSDAQLVAGIVMDNVRATCSNASTLTAGDGGATLTVGERVFSCTADGYLALDGEQVLASGVYKGKTIGFACTQVNDELVSVTVTVYEGGESLASATSAIRSIRSLVGRNPAGN